jgi:hypothetical protein
MAKKNVIDLWFYVDPKTESVEKVLCFHPLGANIRANSDWTGVLPADEDATTDPSNYQVYSYDWGTPGTTIDESFDFDNYDDITPDPLKEFDKGSLTLDYLKQYADLVFDGTTAPDAIDSDEN